MDFIIYNFMKKINEFINYNQLDNLRNYYTEQEITYLDKLAEDLFYETVHLSDPYKISNSETFKNFLNEKYIPYIIYRIFKKERGSFGYLLLIYDLVKITYDNTNNTLTTENIKKNIYEWWLKNKSEYGR